MARQLEARGREFLECFERINRVSAGLRRISTLPLSLSTITMTGRLNLADLPVDEMRLATELAREMGAAMDEYQGFEVDCDVAKAEARGRSARGKRFRYQLPLKRNKKSLKVFHNGMLHATGCTSPLEFLELVDGLRGFLAEAGGIDAELESFDIHLINTLFVVTDPASGRPMTIAPGALLRTLDPGLCADFDTERHPSVKIPLMVDSADGGAGGRVKAATVFVFQTGSISIMGAKRPAHVAAAYEMICGLLDRAADRVCAPDRASRVRSTTAKQALVLVEGYPFNLYSCCQF